MQKFIWHLQRFFVNVLMLPYILNHEAIADPPSIPAASTTNPKMLNFVLRLVSQGLIDIVMSWKLAISISESLFFGSALASCWSISDISILMRCFNILIKSI